MPLEAGHFHAFIIWYYKKIIIYRVGQKKMLYPPTFLLTLAILFKLTQKVLWMIAAAGSDDNNNIKWTTQMQILF